jgi:hypothetical protein
MSCKEHGRKRLWSDLKYYLGNCLEDLRKTTSTKDISQDSRCRGRDSNRSPPEYKAKALPLQPTFSVKDMCVRAVKTAVFFCVLSTMNKVLENVPRMKYERTTSWPWDQTANFYEPASFTHTAVTDFLPAAQAYQVNFWWQNQGKT